MTNFEWECAFWIVIALMLGGTLTLIAMLAFDEEIEP
jgi:hypothetical protein